MKHFLKLVVTAIIFYIAQLLFPDLIYFADIKAILLTTILNFAIGLIVGLVMIIPLIILIGSALNLNSLIGTIIGITISFIIAIFVDAMVLRYISNRYDFFTFYGNNFQLFLFTTVLNILTYTKDEKKKGEDQ